MSIANVGQWLRELGSSVLARQAQLCSDRELLERFVAGSREAAFAALLQRHGPMVWRVCRNIAIRAQDAEDAFQATFLILVRKAASIRRPELLSSWLYGVACRVARRARASAARRQARETDGTAMIAARTDPEPERRDLEPVVHEELERLADKYRAPVVLCYLQGCTSDEAARLLAWPVGTVKGRLRRAREILRGRLERRGLALSAVALAATLAPKASASAAVPAALTQATTQAALAVAAGAPASGIVSAPIAALTRGELQAMLMVKCKVPAAGLLVLILAATFGVWPYYAASSSAAAPGHAPAPDAAAAAVAAQDKVDMTKLHRQSQDNLKQLGIAMHSYHDDLRAFPPAAVIDKNKTPLLSWRVLLLPYIDEQDLFREFKLDEAWDSAHNKKLLAKMPKIYAPVTGKHEPGTTFYQVFVGPGAVFEGMRGIRLTDILDGTSNTILLIEGGEAVPWTKPADLPYDPKKALPKLGGLFKDRIHAAFADGSVQTLRPDFNEQQMRNIIGRNDGQVVVLDDVLLKE
jgi:RNA polymerase sigma factor (sigma-70 family)